MNKPLILITNDDGINSPGIIAAAEAVSDIADIIVCAPNKQQTGMGRAFPRSENLGIIEEVTLSINGNDMKCYSVCGSPAFSVAHCILEIADKKPDLCISGINYGENLGLLLTCSGTLGAVFEADSHNIPGIAISIGADVNTQRSENFEHIDWENAKNILRYLTKDIISHGMPKNVNLYNVNVPRHINTENKNKFKFTTQSRQNYFEFIKPFKRDFKKPYELKSKLLVNTKTLENDSDIYAVHIDNIISVTPINTNMSVVINKNNNLKTVSL